MTDGPILVGGELLDGRLGIGRDPRVVHQHVETAELRDRLLDGRLDLVFVAHVRGTDERRRVRLGFDFGREFRQPILSTGDECDVGTVGRECARAVSRPIPALAPVTIAPLSASGLVAIGETLSR